MFVQIPSVYKVSVAIVGNAWFASVPDIGGIEHLNNIGIAGLSVGALWILWNQTKKDKADHKTEFKAERKLFRETIDNERDAHNLNLQKERDRANKNHDDFVKQAKAQNVLAEAQTEVLGKLTFSIQEALTKIANKKD